MVKGGDFVAKRDYFPAFFKYRSILSSLDDGQVGRIFRAALAYAEDGTSPNLETIEAVAFAFIRQDIDAAADAYAKRCAKNKENVSSRWKKPAEETDSGGDPGDTNVYDRIRTHTNAYEGLPYNTIQNNTIQNIPPSGEITRARTRGSGRSTGKRMTVGGPDASGAADREPVPPTVEDINDYCSEAGLVHLNPGKFYDNYAASGWMRNGEPIRDWRALARKWDAEDAEKAVRQAESGSVGSSSFETSEFFEAALARSYGEEFGLDMSGFGDESAGK